MSSKPSKQRRSLWQAPLHKRRKILSSPLSEELRAKYGIRALPVRKGDTVKVMRGDYKGIEGKITKVNLRDFRINVERVSREKADGTQYQAPLSPSKVLLTKINLDDKLRSRKLKMMAEQAGVETEGKEAKEESA